MSILRISRYGAGSIIYELLRASNHVHRVVEEYNGVFMRFLFPFTINNIRKDLRNNKGEASHGSLNERTITWTV